MKVWVVIYQHRHGIDAWPVFSEEEAQPDAVIEALEDQWEKGETIEVRGPWEPSGSFGEGFHITHG